VLWALTDHLGTVRDVIDNSGTLAELEAQVERLHAAYRAAPGATAN